MLLSTISGPDDLAGLTYEELDALAVEIRELIVSSVSKTGGHLGSNLGAVELTIALHRVYESPQDIMLWDTGHQTYVHKMLTGRAPRFEELRQADGISGYPSREESQHDWIENSHASTVLSYAHGLATAEASDIGTGRRIVAIIGDGALTGGMAYEGINNLGHAKSNVTIILNDNGRSYAPTVSLLTDSLVKIRSNPVYMRRQAKMEQIAENIPWVGDHIERGIHATKAAIRHMWEPPAFFENLGVHYLGPFDGHDINGLEDAMRNAEEFDGPTVVHVLTQKGRGYAPAENDPIKNMHDTSGVLRLARTRRPLPRRSSSSPSSIPNLSPSPPQCPTRPACCPSASASPIAPTTSALPNSTPSPPLREWPWAAFARSLPCTRLSCRVPSTRSTWTLACTANPSCYASTALA